MKTEAQSQEAVTATPEVKTLADAHTFAEYEAIRKGQTVPKESAPAAPADKAEQKESTESAPEETVAKEETDETEDKESEETESEESEEAKPKKKGGFQRRIDKLNARFAEERAAREALERKLAALEAGKPAEKVETKLDTSDAEPSPDDFDTHAAYVKAVTRWTVKQEQKSAQEAEAKSKVEKDQKTKLQTYAEREKAFAEKTEDYQDVLESVDDIRISPAVGQLLVESENGPELAYELAKDKKEYARINALPPLAAARELGKIEVRLASKAAEANKPETKKITQAPKPLTPVGKTAGTVVAKSISDPTLSFSDYERLRREQMRKRRA